VSFGHITSVGKRASSCSAAATPRWTAAARRAAWAPSDVKVIVRSGFEEMKASPWEKEDAMHEGIPILNYHVPKAFVHEGGKLVGMRFEIVKACTTTRAGAAWCPPANPMRCSPATRC
jgi:formate dehydrogenase beta subunit